MKLLPYIYGTFLDKEEMYDLKPHADAPTPAEEEEEQINYDMIQVMQDIDEIFGEPIFITD